MLCMLVNLSQGSDWNLHNVWDFGMIVNKEVECMVVSKFHQKTDQQKVDELKEQINDQIRNAEGTSDSRMAQFVRKRTLTRMNTFKSEHDQAQMVEDESPAS